MNTKFTKGEWSVLGEVVIAEKGHKIIKPLCSLNGRIGPQEDKANANLIAAAPGMYAMIKELSHELNMAIDEINTMRDIHNKDNLTPADHWDKESLHDAQLTLAKARGE